jgi:hypothetical protein
VLGLARRKRRAIIGHVASLRLSDRTSRPRDQANDGTSAADGVKPGRHTVTLD